MTSTTSRRGLLGPGRRGPAFIAHGGGNTVEMAHSSIEAVADYLEVDLWVHRGRFEARHERRTIHPLPFLFEKWYIRFAPREPFGLAELLETAAGRIGLFLDLKNSADETAVLVRRSLDAARATPRIVASSQSWRILRGLASQCPEVDLFYSIDVSAKLDLFLSVSERDLRPRGISCRASLLTPPVIKELHGRGLLVVAWTVDDADRARELVEAGVDGLTTHRTAELRAALGPR